MPEKSVREMNRLELAHYSLASRVFHAVLIGAIVLGLAALMVGLGLYTYALVSRSVSEAFNTARNAAAILERVEDTTRISDAVMALYERQTDAEREDTGSRAYRARFSAFPSRMDYENIHSVLADFLESSDVFDVYIGMYDSERDALIYIVDPDDDPETGYRPGEWESVDHREAEKFLTWDGEGMLYDISNTERYGWMCTAGVPVRDGNGRIAGFVLSDVTLDNIWDNMKMFLLQYVIALFIIVNLFGILLVRHMKKTLVKPINEIADAAVNYVADKRAGAQRTDHFTSLNIRTGDEIENLSLIMADMERDLADYETNLTQVTAEKERIGTELALATRIQADMLPNIFPAFPERKEFDIYASMTPAKEVGGDFYDFFLIDDDHLGLVMADVSGKGVPAALFMMVSKILVQNYAMSGRSPKAVLEATNAQICSNNREEMFVTVWFGILDLKSGLLTAANAGHEYPVLMQSGGRFELVKDKHGFVIGGMDGMKYKEYELQLQPGAKLFLYTDGVPEATDAVGELFGTDRLLDALNGRPESSPQELLKTVDDAVRAFVGEAPQFDDLTMLCIHYTGEKGEKPVKELNLEATLENIPAVTEFVDAELERMDCPLKAQMQIDVAIDELFSNIARYAYNPETGPATVRVEVDETPAVIVTFIDHGKPYDPLAKEDPDVGLSAEEREIGGLGIFLVKKTMDDVSYEYRDGKNILKIKKNM